MSACKDMYQNQKCYDIKVTTAVHNFDPLLAKDISEFRTKLHHRSNAYKRKSEITKGKNTLAIEMLERAVDIGIEADYLLVDSWYAKPNFIKEANELGMSVIARLPNNKLIWNSAFIVALPSALAKPSFSVFNSSISSLYALVAPPTSNAKEAFSKNCFFQF